MKNERQASRQGDSVTNGLIYQEKGSARAPKATTAPSTEIKKNQAENEELDFLFPNSHHQSEQVSVFNIIIANLSPFSLHACFFGCVWL